MGVRVRSEGLGFETVIRVDLASAPGFRVKSSCYCLGRMYTDVFGGRNARGHCRSFECIRFARNICLHEGEGEGLR